MFQLSNGEVLVQFTDGSELGIQSSPMVVRYTDLQGKAFRYVVYTSGVVTQMQSFQNFVNA